MKKLILRVMISAIMVFFCALIAAWSTDQAILSHWNWPESWIVRIVGEKQEEMESAPLDENWQTVSIRLKVQILTGDRRGELDEITIEQLEGSRLELISGQKYLLISDTFADGTTQYSISDRYRIPNVVAFLAAACSGVIAVAGISGLKALLGLLLSIVFLMGWYVPSIIGGAPPIALAIIAVAAIAIVTVMLVVRRRLYWPVAFFGAIGGTLAASLLGWTMVEVWQLSGLGTEGGPLLASTFPNLSLKGVLMAAVIIGAIGAVLDVAISVTSTLAEMVDYDNEISSRRLWQAGLGVGKEVLGSMINTLILAYFGNSLVMVILITGAQPSIMGLLNDPIIAQELVRSVAGTAGLLLTVPITAGICVWWIDRLKKNGRLVARKAERSTNGQN